MVTLRLTFSKRHRGRSEDRSLVRLLGEENQVMARGAIARKPYRKGNVDGLLSIIAERGHARQRASDGDVLELPTAVFVTKDIGSVRVVSKDGDDIERL